MDFSEIKKGAESGDAAMMCELGRRYADGIGVERDFTLAKYWYERAADTEDAFAKVVVGDQLEKGIRLSKDCHEAERLYCRADRAGLPYGAYALGRLYANFLNCCPMKYDMRRAWHYLAKGIKSGHMTSLMLLFYLCVKGKFGVIGRLFGTMTGILALPYIIWTTGRRDAYIRWSGWRDVFPENGAAARRIMRSVPNSKS